MFVVPLAWDSILSGLSDSHSKTDLFRQLRIVLRNEIEPGEPSTFFLPLTFTFGEDED